MKPEVFKEKISFLSNAFQHPLPEQKTLVIYWSYLSEIDDDAFASICDTIIKEEVFFPKISVFLKYSREYIKYPVLKPRVPEFNPC